MVISKFEESAVWDSYTASMLPKKKASKVAKAAEEPFKRVDPLQAPPGCLPSSNEWYGLKVDQTLDELLDQAHPDPIIGGPSYDKLNGLVENLKERSNVMNQIALDVHGPRQTQHAYIVASNALLDQTVKLGFALDAANHTDLANLADAVSDQITKQAAWWLIPLIIAGISAAGGITYGIGHASNNPVTAGLLNDINRALDELKDVAEDEDYKPSHSAVNSFIANISLIKSGILELNAYSEEIDRSLVNIKSIDVKKKPEEAANVLVNLFSDGKDKKIDALVRDLSSKISEVIKAVPDLNEIMLDAVQQHRGTNDSWFAQVKNWWNEHAVNNDAQDAVKACELLQSSCGKYMVGLSKVSEHLGELRSLANQIVTGKPEIIDGKPVDTKDSTSSNVKKQKEYADKYL